MQSNFTGCKTLPTNLCVAQEGRLDQPGHLALVRLQLREHFLRNLVVAEVHLVRGGQDEVLQDGHAGLERLHFLSGAAGSR